QRLPRANDDRHAHRPRMRGHRGQAVDLGPHRHVAGKRLARAGFQNLVQKAAILRRPRREGRLATPEGFGPRRRLDLRKCHSRITVASPRKTKKPTTSVIVVTKLPEASAGSRSNRSSVSGTSTPASAATTRLMTIAAPRTPPRS